ncbi:hypothetical protein ONS95_004684 [Cadophora gregata]|uniref:uncharacterized protein n=1 Tax=Cadophora gregata TaxID=51156 RepID=UPI0026DB9D32|nr:uncharacterized protein ONS95_004684 [Cadophora gregata]KAK0104390.1 hypothetical protein ONS95_004684 [Cadophora gregata]
MLSKLRLSQRLLPSLEPSTRSTGFASVASTSTVEEIVTVTSVLPSVTFPDPQSQVQGPTSGPSISFVPVPSTTAKSAPTTATRPKTVLSAAAYKYLGCYAEGLNVRALGDASFPDDGNTIERCVTACYPYKYAGAEYGRECWCGNELKGASKVSEYDFCNMPCAGNGEQYCGGIVALNVYVVGDAPSASFIPVTVSGTAIMSRKPSSVTATSSSSQVSISKSPQSQAIVSSTSSSAAASTRSASTSSKINSSKASSDSQSLTASSISLSAIASSSSSKITIILSSTFVTSTQAVPISVIVDNGSSMTTSPSVRTQTPLVYMSSISFSSSTTTPSSTPLIKQSLSTSTRPSAKVITTKDPVTAPTTLKAASASQVSSAIPVITTNTQALTKHPIPTALPILSLNTSSPPTTSSKFKPTPVLPPTASNTPITILPPPDTGICIPAFCPTTFTLDPSAIPTDDPISIPESWSGMWTTAPPPLTLAETPMSSIILPASPRPEQTTSVSNPGPSPASKPAISPPQSGCLPAYYTPAPIIATSTVSTTSNTLANSTSTPPSSSQCTHATTSTAHIYRTSSHQLHSSVVTVTSFLTPIPTMRVPSPAASIARGMDFKIFALFAGLWAVLIFVG